MAHLQKLSKLVPYCKIYHTHVAVMTLHRLLDQKWLTEGGECDILDEVLGSE